MTDTMIVYMKLYVFKWNYDTGKYPSDGQGLKIVPEQILTKLYYK